MSHCKDFCQMLGCYNPATVVICRRVRYPTGLRHEAVKVCRRCLPALETTRLLRMDSKGYVKRYVETAN